MELVYLWVEDYKNIQKQGFNFSPRFECEYKDGNLTICDKKKKECKDNNYNENFFGENINITAIVGENGSGKSNIFEALLSDFMASMIPINENYKILTVFYKESENKFYYKSLKVSIFKINGENLRESIALSTKYEIKSIKDTNTFTFHYNYGLDWIVNPENNLPFNKIYHKNDGYRTPFLLQPNKTDNKINLSNIDYLATRDMLSFIIQKEISFDFIDDFFTPVKCKLKYELTDITKSSDDFLYGKVEPYSTANNTIDAYTYYTYIYIIRKTLATKDIDFKILKDENFKSKFIDDKLDKNTIDSFIEYLKSKTFDDIYNDSINYKTYKIKQCFLFIEYLKKQNNFDFYLFANQELIINDNKELLKNLPPWIQIDFFNDKNVSFYSLSYGQKFLIKFLYNLLNQLNNLTSHPEYKNIIILIDEVELGLHPQWQKKYLSILINVLNTKIEGFDFKYNVVCATHSPFILSDLPKENVIFLKNGKQENPFEGKQTFGANIHTLLSHGFFMKDGLMGEFAKEKINEAITYLNQKKLSKEEMDYCENIISIIGEPIIKNQLQKMFDSKRLSKLDIIDELEAELELIKHRIESIRKNQ
ncbi:MAG: AAA family ATPase [Sulfurimonas sp.]|nr:AAA family ATPase [Sulfurimonas sp.]